MAEVQELVQDAVRRMDSAIEHTRNEFNTIRTGRASAALLDRITVDYYGTATPLKQLATINVPEPRMLTIQPFDPRPYSLPCPRLARRWLAPRAAPRETEVIAECVS